MRLQEIQLLNEVPMNPGTFAQGVETGAEKGVKVGFEFEVCVPEATIRGEPAEQKGWYHKVLADYPGTKWTEELEPTDLNDYTVEITKPISYNGKTFRPNVNIVSEIAEEWAAAIVEPQIKKVFDSLVPNIKKRMVANWKQELANKSYDNNAVNFARVCRMSTTKERVRSAFWYAMNLSPKIWKQFWIDVFGTDDLAAIAADPRLRWDDGQVLEDFGIDDDDYDSGDYRGSAEVMAKALTQPFGKPIIFNRYHEKTKDTKHWYIEPDGSLEPNDDDGSCEVVSPPLPVKDAIAALKTFYGIARSMNLYTSVDNNTGLHINVSIPEKLDVLKLAIFVGDEYVIKQWGREDNDYVDSVMKSLTGDLPDMAYYDRPKDKEVPYNPSIKKHYKELLQVAKDISDEHTASVNFNGKYVSFRHAGGDYLNKEDSVINVVGRFVRAMIIASDPNMYRKEYLIKLQKLIGGGPAKVDRNKFQISKVLQYKTKPIKGIWSGLFGFKAEATVKKMLANQQMFEEDDVWSAPPEMVNPICQEILATAISSGGYGSDLKDQAEAVKKKPNLRALYFELSNNQDTLVRYRDETIYSTNNHIDIGVVACCGFEALPGTPMHTAFFQKLVQRAKDEYKRQKGRR